MHRILLYALVVALLYLAWDARRGEILAAGKGFGQTGSGVLLAKAEIDRQGQTGAAPGLYRNASEKRLEARVESMPDAWSQFDLQAEPGPPPEVVLADAEKWMETKFPEGGRTSETAAEEPSATSESGKANGNSEVRGRAATGQSDAAVKSQESSPVYIASLARIECINGDLPAWVGLLDLALRPNARQPEFAGAESLGLGDTAWISDDHGKLLARVEALNGMGLEFDPSWPWIARERRLFWTEGGVSGLPLRQYRLVLQGSGFGQSWSGRLVVVHTSAPASHR